MEVHGNNEDEYIGEKERDAEYGKGDGNTLKKYSSFVKNEEGKRLKLLKVGLEKELR